MEETCPPLSCRASKLFSAFCKFCHCPDVAIFPQKTLESRRQPDATGEASPGTFCFTSRAVKAISQPPTEQSVGSSPASSGQIWGRWEAQVQVLSLQCGCTSTGRERRDLQFPWLQKPAASYSDSLPVNWPAVPKIPWVRKCR